MRTLLIVCLFALLAAVPEVRIASQPQITISAPLNLDDPAIRDVDLQDMEAGDRLKVDLQLVNRSASSVIIKNAEYGCSCVSGIIATPIIQPNSTGSIELDFRTLGRKGPWDNTVSIEFMTDSQDKCFAHWNFLFDLKARVRLVDSESGVAGLLGGSSEEGTMVTRYRARIEGFPANLPPDAKLSFLSPLEDDSGHVYQVEMVKDEWKQSGYLEVNLTTANAGERLAASAPTSNLLFPVVIDSPALKSPLVRRIPVVLFQEIAGGKGSGWNTLKLGGWTGESPPSLYIMLPVGEGPHSPVPVLQFSSAETGFDASSLATSKDVVELQYQSSQENFLSYRSPVRLTSSVLLFVVDSSKGPYLPITVSGEPDADGAVELVLPESRRLPISFSTGEAVPASLNGLVLQLYYPSNDDPRLVSRTGERFVFFAVWNIHLKDHLLPAFENIFAGTEGPVSFKLYGPPPPSIVEGRTAYPVNLSFDRCSLAGAFEAGEFLLGPKEKQKEKKPE